MLTTVTLGEAGGPTENIKPSDRKSRKKARRNGLISDLGNLLHTTCITSTHNGNFKYPGRELPYPNILYRLFPKYNVISGDTLVHKRSLYNGSELYPGIYEA